MKTEKHEVHSWAIICPKTLVIQCYLDPAVPKYVETIKEYQKGGFIVSKLYGEVNIPEESLTFTRSEIVKVLEPDLIPVMIDFIVRQLGFKNRGIK